MRTEIVITLLVDSLCDDDELKVGDTMRLGGGASAETTFKRIR